jgi:putative oxidoreductase
VKVAFLIGRIVVGFFYISNGVNLFLHRAMTVGYAAAKGVPYPALAVPVAAAFLVVGGLSLLLGWRPTVGIGAIVLFLVPVTFYMHPFWNEAGAERLNDTVNFTKNLALLGAALMLAAIPRPWMASVETGRRSLSEEAPVDLPARREQRSARG